VLSAESSTGGEDGDGWFGWGRAEDARHTLPAPRHAVGAAKAKAVDACRVEDAPSAACRTEGSRRLGGRFMIQAACRAGSAMERVGALVREVCGCAGSWSAADTEKRTFDEADKLQTARAC
jgi:hypothetical protein